MMNATLKKELPGIIIHENWHIDAERVCSYDATGGSFSAGFIAKHDDGRLAFVKVLDPTVDTTLDTDAQLKDLEDRLAIFNYETSLLDKCKEYGIKRVVRLLHKGSLKLDS